MIYAQKRNGSASTGVKEILEGISKYFELETAALKQHAKRGDVARRCAITLCWDLAGLSHSEIAALFKMPTSNSVAQMIRRTKTKDARILVNLKKQLNQK